MVRALLAEGRIESAARLLGRPYSISGRVVRGDGVGRKLGFATVGRLPKAFRHPSKGYVDALVMYKWLET